MQNERRRKAKEGQEDSFFFLLKKKLSFYESNVTRRALTGSQIAQEKHVDGSCKWSKLLFFLFSFLVCRVKRQLLAQKEECVRVMERLAKYSSGSGGNERGNEKK